MSTEDSSKDRNQELQPVVGGPIPDYEAGRRSITVRGGKTRREMVKEKRQFQVKTRPFMLVAFFVLLGLLAIPLRIFSELRISTT